MKEGETVLREQKTVKTGCPCKDRVELKSSKEARSTVLLDSMDEVGVDILLEKLMDRNNLNMAYKRVKQNGGSAEVDGMTVEEMLPYLKEHNKRIVEELRMGTYKPKPVRRVEIPKPDRGK